MTGMWWAFSLLICPVATAHADAETLDGITITARHHRYDYRRAAFGEAWANGGPCDTRDKILNRDLTEVTHVSTKRCPDAVATGVLDDPYTGSVISFQRGAKTGEAVQIDHVVPLAYAWDMGAYAWTDAQRQRFANDPDELPVVQGKANEDTGDSPPGRWMPPNTARHSSWSSCSRQSRGGAGADTTATAQMEDRMQLYRDDAGRLFTEDELRA
jgi:Protein of unknown function (DUF1524)